MEPVKDFSFFVTLINNYREQNDNPVTNCLLLPARIQTYTQQKRFYFELDRRGLFFYVDEEDYYQLFMYASADSDLKFHSQDKPIVINQVVIPKVSKESAEVFEKKILEGGFNKYLTYQRMKLDKGSYIQNEQKGEKLLAKGYQLKVAKEKQYKEIDAIWKRILDPYSNLPSLRELVEYIKSGSVYCVTDEENQIVGAILRKIEHKSCEIRHLAVEENHRGRNLAYSLFSYCIDDMMDDKQLFLWVEVDNFAAIKLYKKLGFFSDEIKLNQFLLN